MPAFLKAKELGTLFSHLSPPFTVPHWQGRNSFVRDNCQLLEGTVLPEGAVVPPFTVVRYSDIET